MNELIQIAEQSIGNGVVQTVNARDLHAALGVKKQFTDWVKTYTKKFIKNQDFTLVRVKLESGHVHTDYALSLDMAKHVAMMSETDKSMDVRQYFIECEKKLKSAPVLDPANLSRMQLIQIALDAESGRLKLEAVVAEQAPKVAALDRIATADGSLCITDAAKHLQIRPKVLFDYLKRNVWIYRRQGNSHWVGYQHRVQQGLVEHKVTTVLQPDGAERVKEQVRITPKGMGRLSSDLGVEMEESA